MRKLIVVVLAVAFAGAASAADWRDLRVDGSSEEAFARSMTAFKDALSPAREYVFGEALQHIWNEGEKAAQAEQREYTADEFYRELDGRRYEEVVTLTDPTGDTAKRRYRIAYVACCRPAAGHPGNSNVPSDAYWTFNSGVPRASTDLFGPRPSQQ